MRLQQIDAVDGWKDTTGIGGVGFAGGVKFYLLGSVTPPNPSAICIIKIELRNKDV